MTAIRLIVFPVGGLPPEDWHVEADPSGGFLTSLRAIVGGDVECVELDAELDAWYPADSRALPFNRLLPATGVSVPGGMGEVIEVEPGRAAPAGAPATWRMRGTFAIARHGADGELAGVTDDDVRRFAAAAPAEPR